MLQEAPVVPLGSVVTGQGEMGKRQSGVRCLVFREMPERQLACHVGVRVVVCQHYFLQNSKLYPPSPLATSKTYLRPKITEPRP
jgi:hypothetical protein